MRSTYLPRLFAAVFGCVRGVCRSWPQRATPGATSPPIARAAITATAARGAAIPDLAGMDKATIVAARAGVSRRQAALDDHAAARQGLYRRADRSRGFVSGGAEAVTWRRGASARRRFLGAGAAMLLARDTRRLRQRGAGDRAESRRRRRRLRRRDGGALSAPVERRHDSRHAGRARRRVRFLSVVQSGDRRQQAACRHHHRLRRPRKTGCAQNPRRGGRDRSVGADRSPGAGRDASLRPADPRAGRRLRLRRHSGAEAARLRRRWCRMRGRRDRKRSRLRARLEAMRDGGVFAIHVPRAPYRCPPAPYERACQVANYFSRHKPKSKVIILDANEEVQSKKALFTAAWSGRYSGYVEYRPNSELVDVDPAARRSSSISTMCAPM